MMIIVYALLIPWILYGFVQIAIGLAEIAIGLIQIFCGLVQMLFVAIRKLVDASKWQPTPKIKKS